MSTHSSFKLPRILAGFAIAAVLSSPVIGNAGGADLAARRAGFSHALDVAENRPSHEFAAAARPYADHPLAPYLEYAALRRQLGQLDATRIDTFLSRHADLPIAATLRNQALYALAARRDWAGFRQLYVTSEDPALRCADLRARATTPPDPAWIDAALALWLTGHSQPTLCDEVFASLRASGSLTPARHLERIEHAAAEHELGLMRFLARSLPAAQATQVLAEADFLANPRLAGTRNWPINPHTRSIIALALEREARREPEAAESLLAALQDRFALDPAQRGRARAQIALWSAASYLPDSARRFAAVPDAAWDERLHEWQVREALARGDDAGALAAIARMPESQRADERWRYFAARLNERAGAVDVARSAYANLASDASYYGFLAAERIDAPYALCPLAVPPGDAARARAAADPGFIRAMELFALGRMAWARREWDAMKARLPAAERRAAVALALEAGWNDRGTFTLREGEDLRYYELRFPLPWRTQLEREARKYALAPSWVAALIRAESAWAPDARSPANARGLMQLLPTTARAEAKRRGLRFPGGDGLYRAEDNLALGTAHLATMLEQHGGQPFLATAAYNAGPTPIARWLARHPPADIDLWVETIPYRETREYVARILAFSLIYDWRLHGKAEAIGTRARGLVVPDFQRRAFACPASTAAAPA